MALASAGLTLASVALAPSAALAAVTFDYSENLVLANPLPEGTPPYLTALIQDINDDASLGANQVSITLTNNLAGTSSVTQIAFNINPFPASAPTATGNIGPIPIPNGPPNKTDVQIADNGVVVPGSGTVTGFDLSIDMNPNIYNQGKTLKLIVTDITSPSVITANSFLSKNFDGEGNFYTLAKIQSIGIEGQQSTVIVGKVRKIPGPLPILGAGIAFAYSRRMRRRVSDTTTHFPSMKSLPSLA